MNAATLTEPNKVLFCFVHLSYNGYLKTVFNLQIASDRLKKELGVGGVEYTAIMLSSTDFSVAHYIYLTFEINIK